MTPPGEADGRGIDRRQLLKTIGATTAGLVAVSGTATAQKTQFTGCERVCTGTNGSYAVVAVDDTVTCRSMTATDGVDVPWDWQSYCYEAAEGETVIGILEADTATADSSEGTCTFCPNPNPCADAAYDSVASVVSTLNGTGACGSCVGHIEAGGDCTTYTKPGDDGDGSDDSGTGDDGEGESGDGSGNESTDDTESGSGDDSEDESGSDETGDESESTEPTGGTTEPTDESDEVSDFDTKADYSEDREIWKSDLVESDTTEAPSWECENTTEDPTPMERWYDRDDTPVDPMDRQRCGPGSESEEDGTLTAIERWFARDDTPGRSD